MNKISVLLIKGTAIVGLVVLLLCIICFKTVDHTPYNKSRFYELQQQELKKISLQKAVLNADTLQVGWAKVNLLPPFTTPIAIDAHRKGKHFTAVHDSIYIRAFVFKKGGVKIAYVCADLLIMPPTVSNMFDTLMQAQGFSNNNIFFTATHTHASIGAWHNSYVGEIFAGKYDARIPPHIATCIKTAITEAEKNCSPAGVGFAALPTQNLVFNRLVKEEGGVDSLLRVVKITKTNGESAAIVTFAAHATVFHEDMMQLTGDWPGLLLQQLERSGKISFAAFSAGAVGSQGPFEVSPEQETQAKYMAEGVAGVILHNYDSIPARIQALGHNLNMHRVQLHLREPNLRLTSVIVLRPWLFKRLFGDEKVYVSVFKLGNMTFAGTPCDFSGELVADIDAQAAQMGQHLLVTSFNGGYIGYITADEWYEMDTYETKTMGWFGPGNGAYLSSVIKHLILF